MPRKKSQPAEKPAPLKWEFDASIPTHDFLEGMPLSEVWDLQQAVEGFAYWLEKDRFLTWEAVVAQEQGLSLTARQQEALQGLINFGDPSDEQVLYINEIPRPSEPWYVILNKIAPHLLIEPFRTFDVQEEVKSLGWEQIMDALEKHCEGLSLPSGVSSYHDVVPADLRHKLWLQYCFDILRGLGQAEDLTLEEDDPWRVEDLILRMRRCKESLAYFGLTLEELLAKVDMPERDRPVFVKLMKEKLGLISAQEQITDHL